MKLPEETEGIEAFMGSRVHEVLERLYRDLLVSKTNTLGELLAFYGEQWDRNWHDAVVVVRKDLGPENYRETGRKCIERYYAHYEPFDGAQTIGVEMEVPVRIESGGERFDLVGYLDRLDVRPDGTYEIHDYKTSARLPRQEDLDRDRQLALYQIGLPGLFPDAKRVDLVWHYLVFDREARSHRSEADLTRLKSDVADAIRAIEEAKELEHFPARPGKLCDWCEYRPVCPEWVHVAAVEDLPANEYLKETGVALVNEYARLAEELATKEKEVEAKLGKIEEALLAYADRLGATVVAGSDHEARISTVESLKLPLKGTPKRQALVAILQKAGLWEDLADLDLSALKARLRDGGLPADVRHVLEPFVTREKRRRVSLARRRERDAT